MWNPLLDATDSRSTQILFLSFAASTISLVTSLVCLQEKSLLESVQVVMVMQPFGRRELSAESDQRLVWVRLCVRIPVQIDVQIGIWLQCTVQHRECLATGSQRPTGQLLGCRLCQLCFVLHLPITWL